LSDLNPADPAEVTDQTDEQTPAAESTDETPDTFPRAYVEELRKENARYRDRAKSADALAERLHGALVAATGRLADPTDLPYDEKHLDDADALSAAIDELLARKPHLADRRPRGDVGQGAREQSAPVGLGSLLRARA